MLKRSNKTQLPQLTQPQLQQQFFPRFISILPQPKSQSPYPYPNEYRYPSQYPDLFQIPRSQPPQYQQPHPVNQR